MCSINGLKLVAIGDRANQGVHAAPWVMHGHALYRLLCSPVLAHALDPPPDPCGPEADLDGWNDKEGEYTFLYGIDQAVAPPGASLLLKCLAMDDTLLVTLLASSSSSGSTPPGPQGAKKKAHLPETLELSLTRHAVPEGGSPTAALVPNQYGHLQDLINAVHAAIETQVLSGFSPLP